MYAGCKGHLPKPLASNTCLSQLYINLLHLSVPLATCHLLSNTCFSHLDKPRVSPTFTRTLVCIPLTQEYLYSHLLRHQTKVSILLYTRQNLHQQGFSCEFYILRYYINDNFDNFYFDKFMWIFPI